MSDHAFPLRLVDETAAPAAAPAEHALVESYRRLADVFHDVLAEQSLDALLDRIADALAELVPHDSLTIYEADELRRVLVPVWARDKWADKILADRCPFGVGLTGWGVEHREPVRVNQAHLDPRVSTVAGTPADEPEALITIPLIARDSIKGALNVYRLGEDASFDDDEFELAKRFGDAAALALDNAQIRARLEHQAQTDPLTGLYNHRTFHERLRAALTKASRSHDSVSVLMLDIDDFKRVNDVYGHGSGDEILRSLAEALRSVVRASDVVCRLGGEEFAIVMTARDAMHAERLARRLVEHIASAEFVPAGRITISVGLARGPEHAMNPRELIACAEAAMMTAKARGKNQIVLYDESALERPDAPAETTARDVRSIAHMKMLQSLGGKLNRLNDVREIGSVIANELRSLIDYHNCRVFVVEGVDVRPIAFVGAFAGAQTSMEVLACKLGEGMTGYVASTGESLLVGDAANYPRSRQVEGTDRIDESQIYVPLTFGSRVIGVIVISKLGLDQFDEDDVRLLEVLAGHAAVALENASLYESARREAERATALLEFSRELATAEGMDEVVDRIVELSARTLGSPRASVWLQRTAGDNFGARATYGYSELDHERLARVRFDHDEAHAFLDGKEPFVVTPEQQAAMDGAAEVGAGDAFAVAPLMLDGGRLGCIAVAIPEDGGFSERNLRLLAGVAHQAKLALTNAASFHSLETTFLETVEALANALEANDEYTSSHARWITDFALKVGAGLGLDSRQLKRLELGALFHDIGKIGIPEAVLSKPGPLTDGERRLIERHPELGERIIAPIDRLEEVRPIVRHCHERYDGMGYPDRMVGEEIPLESRIIFVCDAYHAMTTDRPYRKKLPKTEAVQRLEDGAGTQFDPRVVEVAKLVLAELGETPNLSY
ncbi:MAG: diguanylate cyclase [Actinobacteria bacterium]|nr:MAG: diguanylate cyclase [Actinomycetota bacterium]